MNHGKTLTAALATLFMLGVVLAGCGGQSDVDSQGSQDTASGETRKQESGGTSAETKITIGRVSDAGPGRRLVVRSSVGDQEKERIVLVVTKNARITLDGKDAKLEDAEEGQQAQVKYIVKNERNRAREVTLYGENSQ